MSMREELLQLVPPPADGVSSSVDWAEFESSLGTRLPSDYKWLIDRYGPGKFDNFLYILQPSSPFEPIQLAHSARRSGEILDQLRESGEAIPYPTSELLPVAKTDNGDTVYWIRQPLNDPDSWTITGNAARNTKWPEFSGGIVEFLVATLSGVRHFEIFPRSFPTGNPQFERPALRRPRQPRR